MTDRMPEAEVSLRFAMYLLSLPAAAQSVSVAVDGAGVRVGDQQIFDIVSFMAQAGWVQTTHNPRHRNPWTGDYEREGRKLFLHSRPGEGDVVGYVGSRRIVAECKKGPLVHRPGNPERALLAAALGQAVLLKVDPADIPVVAVPDTEAFRRLAEDFRSRPLVSKTGIQICLVNPSGAVAGFAPAG
jgi:hypothetical protein